MRQITTAEYEANVGLIHNVARACFARVQAVGVAMDYEDVFQELSVTFVKAWARFDETKGNRFSTYFVTAARNEFNRHVEKMVAERAEHGVRSVEEMSSSDDGDDDWALDQIAGASPDPLARAEAKEMLERLDRRLRPLTKLALDWLMNPPEELERELKASQQHVEFARTFGLPMRRPTDITIGGVLWFLHMLNPQAVSKQDIRDTREELDLVLAEIQS